MVRPVATDMIFVNSTHPVHVQLIPESRVNSLSYNLPQPPMPQRRPQTPMPSSHLGQSTALNSLLRLTGDMASFHLDLPII